jgi:hypothetical protein
VSDKELYDLYVEHIWGNIPDVYRDELDMCEKAILAGIRTIVGLAYERAAQEVEKCETIGRAARTIAAADIRALKDTPV